VKRRLLVGVPGTKKPGWANRAHPAKVIRLPALRPDQARDVNWKVYSPIPAPARGLRLSVIALEAE
jgi:hypothetical protein